MGFLPKMSLIASLFLSGMVHADQNSVAVQAFKKTWVAKALKLQREMDVKLPLNQSTFLGTHNSENAISYQIPFIRYIDPNQILSIYDQLEMGMRSIEFDVHWYLGAHFRKDILLSHALSNHLGCSTQDRPVTEGLAELRDWLQQNPHEVVILYFDRGVALDGHEPRLASYLQDYLGEYIYKPTRVRERHGDAPRCVSLPGTLSKADVLNAGKQLIIVTKDCDDNKAHYEELDRYKLNWNDYIFAGIGHVKNHLFTILDSTIGDDFTPYPDCSASTVFHDDPEHTVPWRIFEDRTMLSGIISPNRKVLAADIKTMVDCGINWQTMDMLSVDDDRLAAAVWSWAPNFPVENQGQQCAMYKAGEGIENMACTTSLAAFACKNIASQFKAVASSGKWQDGEAICQAQAGTDWHFAMPLNGKQMLLFKQDAQVKQLQQVWLNYFEDESMSWRV